MRHSVISGWFGIDATLVADVAAAPDDRVGIEYLAIIPGPRRSDPIILSRHRREIARAYQASAARRSDAHECDHVVVAIVRGDPFEATVIVIRFPQRRMVTVD